MGNLTIRDLDDRVIERLKARAKANHRSLEDEIRYVLGQRSCPEEIEKCNYWFLARKR